MNIIELSDLLINNYTEIKTKMIIYSKHLSYTYSLTAIELSFCNDNTRIHYKNKTINLYNNKNILIKCILTSLCADVGKYVTSVSTLVSRARSSRPTLRTSCKY